MFRFKRKQITIRHWSFENAEKHYIMLLFLLYMRLILVVGSFLVGIL